MKEEAYLYDKLLLPNVAGGHLFHSNEARLNWMSTNLHKSYS